MEKVAQFEKLIVDKKLHKAIEFPWVRCHIALLRSNVKQDIIDSGIQLSQLSPGFVQKHWNKVKRLTLVDPFRMGKLADLVMQTQEIEGDIIECGSYKGGTGLLMALLLKELKSTKKIHLFDSFSGLPEPDLQHDKGYKKGQFKSNYDKLQAIIEEYELEQYVVLHKGWFSETVPVFIKINQPTISLLHLDCDLYTSTMDCFPDLYPLVSSGGIVALDDFNDGGGGEKKAILQVLTAMEQTACLVVAPASQGYFVKDAPIRKGAIADGTQYYDIKEIMENTPYLEWIKGDIEEDYYLKLQSLIPESMNRDTILKELNGIIEYVLDLENINLTESDKVRGIEDWDSIMHVEIIVQIEEQFNVKFRTIEIEKFEVLADMISAISEKRLN